MRKPDFFIVGAPRSGTSAMAEYLGRHREIFMPDGEPHFFGTDFYGPGFIRDETKYLSLFSGAKDEKRLGEKSVRYLSSKKAAQEIKAFMPSASIIIMLRDPLEQIRSSHSLRIYRGDEDLNDLEAALEAEEDRKRGLRLPGGVPKELAWWIFYRETPRYHQQVQRFLDFFGRDNVHVIIFDDFASDTASVFRETLRFLGVEPDFQIDYRKVNANRRVRNRALQNILENPPPPARSLARMVLPKRFRRRLVRGLKHGNSIYEPRPPLDGELRKRLEAEFLPDVEALSELLGRDLTHWCRSLAD